MSKRVAIILGAIVAALLVAVVILLAVIIQQNNAAAEQADHERIVKICEGQYADPYGRDLGPMTQCIEDLKD